MKGKTPITLTTNEKKLTLERFKAIQEGKTKKEREFNPNITHSTSRQSLTVHYTINKKPRTKEFKYKMKGYEAKLTEANNFIEELKLNHKAVTEHQMKYAEVMHELVLAHMNIKCDSPYEEENIKCDHKIFNYEDDDEYDDSNDELNNIHMYDSDDDNFYYDWRVYFYIDLLISI